MREIKFRAWDRVQKRFAGATLEGDGWAIGDDAREFVELDAWEQFTGLLDKNGKEIWEGDVVVVPKKYPFFTPPEGSDINLNDYPDIENGVRNYVGIVEWIYSQWQVVLQCVNPKASGISDGMNDGLNDDGIDEGGKSGWEVIGNIHENPELLQ